MKQKPKSFNNHSFLRQKRKLWDKNHFDSQLANFETKKSYIVNEYHISRPKNVSRNFLKNAQFGEKN